MIKRTVDMYRRRLLQGAGGLVIGLPMLETFMPRKALAQATGPGRKLYAAFMQQQNGVIQEQFWPTALGPLTPESMAATTAVSEIKDYASKLLVVRRVNFPFGNPVGCGHSSGCNQSLTAAKMKGRVNRSTPVSESADMRIAALLTPGKEPLTLYAGRKAGYLDDAFSYGAGGSVRAGENNPQNVFMRLTGGMTQPPAPTPPGGVPDPGAGQAQMRAALRQKSINDLLRAQIEGLMGRKELSKSDKDRLTTHFQAIRDLEVGMGNVLGPMPSTGDLGGRIAAVGMHTANDKMEDVVRLQLELIALSFASDRARVATLQIGEGNDHTRYMVGGMLAPPYHYVSHRVLSDGSGGTRINNAVELHHGIDRIHGRFFKHFLDKLTQYKTVDGRPILDDTVAVWLNSNADGPPHGVTNVPHIVAGSAGGFLKQGQYIDAGGVTNNMFLNTIITAVIGGKSAPAPVTDFGDPGLRKELIPGMLA
jgi:hypothetical protein